MMSRIESSHTMRWWKGIALAAAAVALAACGGQSVSPQDQRAIETLIEHHYSAPSCADLTASGRTAFGHPVDDAACEVDLASQKPKDVQVADVEVDGAHGTAVADGYTFKVVKVDGVWLIDG